jgi:hypothetical protein
VAEIGWRVDPRGHICGHSDGRTEAATATSYEIADRQGLAVEAIKTLTDAIATEAALPEADKREAVEFVSALGEDLA